jgi:hypothetical protein
MFDDKNRLQELANNLELVQGRITSNGPTFSLVQ